MDDTWWPDLLKHIPEENPWSQPMVTVAEINGFGTPSRGQRHSWVALIAPEDLGRMNGKLACLGSRVETSGPHPIADDTRPYRPRFWIEANLADERLKLDPLVLSWQAHNRTAMVLEPGFTMTYGLMPRALADGSLHWDDPAAPEYDIAVIDPPSHYQFPHCPTARVRVSRDHLQDYLSLTKRILIQVYYETRSGPVDRAAARFLGDKSHLDADFDDRVVDVRCDPESGYTAQVWGARILARPGDLPITEDTLDTQGLAWPGISTPLTRQSVRSLRFGDDTLFVRDEVLAIYEGKPEFELSPESGSVSCGNQWSVGFIRRVGRDLLRLEGRKLYEGAPSRVVTHWHAFAASPPPAESLAALHRTPNVATRAKDLTDALVNLGQQLEIFATGLGIQDLTAHDFIGMDPVQRQRSGWWTAPFVEPIARHIPQNLSEPGFLSRCLDLDKVAVEALGEGALRRLVNAFGPQPDTSPYRGLKLLDRLICLAQIAHDSGLPLIEAKDEILKRLGASGKVTFKPVIRLFALSDLRQLAGHRKDASGIPDALARFGLDPAATASGWGTTLDGIYDGTIGDVRHAAEILDRALHG